MFKKKFDILKCHKTCQREQVSQFWKYLLQNWFTFVSTNFLPYGYKLINLWLYFLDLVDYPSHLQWCLAPNFAYLEKIEPLTIHI